MCVAKVLLWDVKWHLLACKRSSFRMQKVFIHVVKDALLPW